MGILISEVNETLPFVGSGKKLSILFGKKVFHKIAESSSGFFFKRLGVKKYGGQLVMPGNIIIRQRGTKIFPGDNVKMGRDHSIFSIIKGKVFFKKSKSDRTFVSVKPN